ncbi:MAG: adenylate/guanylate cyclase domain-containing protein [Synechococcus sp.]
MSIAPHTLSTYVPQLLLRHLAQQPQPLVASQQCFNGVTLLADISGFTALTEHYSQTGPQGVETLTQLLNSTFDLAIATVIDRGGDVVKFAGDALVAVWPLDVAVQAAVKESNASTPLASVYRAAAVALDIQSRVATQLQQTDFGYSPQISLRIGIDVGEVNWMQVGGVGDRWHCVMAGTTLQRLQQTVKQAAPTQVVLSAEAHAIIGRYSHGHLLQKNHFLLQSLLALPSNPSRTLPQANPKGRSSISSSNSTSSDRPRNPAEIQSSATHFASTQTILPPADNSAGLAALKSFVHSTVLSRLEAGQSNWLAEFRQVTAVFVHLPNWGRQQLLPHLQEIAVGLQRTAKRYEGILAFSTDDKGTSAFIAFGLPLMAHDNDAERGVQTALGIRQLLQSAGQQWAIGVATGRAFCGSVGNHQRQEYTTIGGAINLAARLMQAAIHYRANDYILCDRRTYQATAPLFQFQTHDRILIKGWEEPQPVYSPSNRTETQSSYRPPTHLSIAGRVTEQAQIEAAVQALIGQRQGGVLLLEGEAGIGKSQLLQKLHDRARSCGIQTLRGGGDSIERQVPYRAWRAPISHLLELEGRSPQEKQQHLLQQTSQREDWQPLLPLLTPILELDLPDNSVTSTMQGQVRADNTRALLIGLLNDRLTNKLTTILLDDAHWMDSASWQLAASITQRLPSLLLAIATRPIASLPKSYSSLCSAPSSLYLRLDTLSLQETQQLLCSCLKSDTISDRLLHTIFNKSQGQPLFSEQLALSMEVTGALVRRGPVCDLALNHHKRSQLDLPNTVRGAIVSRLDLLEPTPQLVLKTASAIGRVFLVDLLQDIYPVQLTHSSMSQSLEDLSAQQLTTLVQPAPDLSYQFRHVITQEVAYSLMVFSQRRALHRATAVWFETNSRAAEGDPSVLAYHWVRAENWAKAIQYLGQAGEQALRNGANAEAVEFLEQAIAIEHQHPLSSLSSRDGNAGTDLAIGSISLHRARWHRQLGDAYVGLGNLNASCTALQTCISILGRNFPRAPWSVALLSFQELLIQVLRRSGLQPQRRTSRFRFLRSGHTVQSLKEMSLACSHLGEVYYYSNQRSLATYATLHGLNLAELAGPSPELARIYANMCFATGINNVHSLSRRYARLALDTLSATPDPTAGSWVNLVLGAYYSSVGNWGTAKQLSLQASDSFANLRDRHREGEAQASLAAIEHWQGHYATAILHWQRTHQLGLQCDNLQMQLWGLLGQAETHLIRGNWHSAVPFLKRAMEMDTEYRDLACEQFRLQALLAQIRLRQGQIAAARQLALDALRSVDGLGAVVLYLVESYASITAVFLTLWAQAPTDPQLRDDALNACLAQARYATAFPISQPRTLLHRGCWNAIAHRPNRAKEFWRRCLRTANRLQMPYEVALAHWHLSPLTSQQPSNSHQEAAQQGFVELGISHPADSFPPVTAFDCAS